MYDEKLKMCLLLELGKASEMPKHFQVKWIIWQKHKTNFKRSIQPDISFKLDAYNMPSDITFSIKQEIVEKILWVPKKWLLNKLVSVSGPWKQACRFQSFPYCTNDSFGHRSIH